MTTPNLPTVDDFPASGPHALAPVAVRGVGRVVDELITGLPFIVLTLVLVPGLLEQQKDGQPVPEIPLWIDAVSVAAAVIYETVLIAWRGQTIGKSIAGTRVARFTDGQCPTWSQACIRCLVPAAVAVALTVIGLPSVLVAGVYLTAMFNPLTRGWHDLAAGTVVVRAR